jgi:hypothetical protein
MASNKKQQPDPYPSDRLDPETDPDPHQFADDKPIGMEYEPIEHFFKGLRLYLEAKIWMRIRIRVKSWIRIHICIN